LRRVGGAVGLLRQAAGVLIAAALAAAAIGAFGSGETIVVYLVRHAEKQAGSNDPDLSAAGRERARTLAQLLQDTGIQAIYSTDFARSRETAAPLASALGLGIEVYDADHLPEFAAALLAREGSTLVVGHSNTTSELVGMLGGEPGPPIDEPTEYDRLYVVSVRPDGSVTTELRRYGDASTP